MRAFGWLKKLRKNERGNALVIAAATMPLIIGAAAIAVDTIQVSLARRMLQRSADSAALAGAYALVQSQEVDASVNHDLAFNNDVPLNGAPDIQHAPEAGPFTGNNRAVRVVLTAQRPVPFISFFTNSSMTVNAEATAAIVFAGQFCMVSLEEGNTTGITFTGSTTVNLGCGVATNSTSATAVAADGSSTVIASPVSAVGGVPQSASYRGNTVLLPYAPPQEDPFADLPAPTVPSDCQNKYSVNPQQAAPPITPTASGVYCFRGMDIKGTVTLPPGVYVIDGAELEFGAQANVTGTGVTFILTSSTAASNPSSIAELDMHGHAVLNITAPTSGTYEGVLMYQDRRAPLVNRNLNGNAQSRFEGGFYFPSSQLTFNGNAGMRTECLQLVARRLVFSGNSNIQNTCPANGAQAFDASMVRLVG